MVETDMPSKEGAKMSRRRVFNFNCEIDHSEPLRASELILGVLAVVSPAISLTLIENIIPKMV